MSDVIHVLPENIANQIAAGEVIQRPCSVLKELVENALDAGANRIHIKIEEAGKSLLSVTDNGKGMSLFDARMAFERHATSKIEKVEDLFSLRTMGFRGEALPSIASVAQVELTTRQIDSELGIRLTLMGSEVVDTKQVAALPGSTFVVRNLFFNVPARRRFLKSQQTEQRHLISQFERIALVANEVQFTLEADGKILYELPATTLRRRIEDVMGRHVEKGLLPLDFDNEMCHIKGFIGTPELAKRKGAHQFFFVNGRYMQHPYFHRAVCNVYDKLIPSGYRPSYFIYFEINPERIDVNIHPTKTEIKFLDEQSIFRLLTLVLRQALNQAMSLPSIDFDAEQRVDIPHYTGRSEELLPQPGSALDPQFDPFSFGERPSTLPPRPNAASWQSFLSSFQKGKSLSTPTQRPQEKALPPCELFSTEVPSTVQKITSIVPDRCLIYQQRYVVTVLSSGLTLVHIDRARLRVLWERARNLLLTQEPATGQRCLTPDILYFSPSESMALSANLEVLESLGFELSPLGNESYSLLAFPSNLKEQAQEAIAAAIDKILEIDEPTREELAEAMALLVAQRDLREGLLPVSSPTEAEKLLSELFSHTDSCYTPTGKRILQVLPEETLDQFFN